jgi:hypothetical protein
MTKQIDQRARWVWKQLLQAYGSRLTESYGKDPPDSWQDAMGEMSQEQLNFGVRKVIRENVNHPPTLGAFLQACNDFPVPLVVEGGPSIQSQLCAFASVRHFEALTPTQQRGPWTYLYREWRDESKVTPFNKTGRCTECTGLVIEPDGASPGYRIMVEDMQMDSQGHNRAIQSFKPGPRPKQD